MNKLSRPACAQQGAALMIGLMLLLVLTILGIAAIRGTTTQERMSANSQQYATTFQATESAIRTVMGYLRGQILPPASMTQSILITALNNGTAPTATQLNATAIQADTDSANDVTATATTIYTGTAPLSGFRMVVESGSYVGYQFTINSTGNQTGSNATAHHLQGVSRVGPKP
ncbi:MAG: pilus assembly PilX family protein [Stenotrophobium sp.]